MRQELIIFVLILVANGVIAAWKKHKESAAKAEAARGQGSPPPQAKPVAKPRKLARPSPAAAARKGANAKAPRRSPQVTAAESPVVTRASEETRPTAHAAVAALATRAGSTPAARQPTRPGGVRSVPRLMPLAAVDPRDLLRNRAALRQAIILGEILGPPRSLSGGR